MATTASFCKHRLHQLSQFGNRDCEFRLVPAVCELKITGDHRTTMSTSTDWDLDAYKTDYESEEHWELRRLFMETHKEKFGEDELVCLAQVFTNIEFMGCRYPAETMRMVGELSQDVAKDFRKQRENRLQRTFVKASDAAEAKFKPRTN